jgi:nitrate/nitrite-specific signal transduction histidine kinase
MFKKKLSENHIKLFTIIMFITACIAVSVTIYYTFTIIKFTRQLEEYSQVLNERTFDESYEMENIYHN